MIPLTSVNTQIVALRSSELA